MSDSAEIAGREGPSAPGADAPPTSASSPTPAKTDLFYRTFGDQSRQPVVFVHGGPGSNSLVFESAAEVLAGSGYFVVTYDQRGAARSPKATTAEYNYKRTAQDLDDLIRTLGLSSPILLGHSFGGSISLNFMDLHPGVAKGVVLIGSPMSFPETYLTILRNAAVIYRSRWDFTKASEMDALRAKMFPRGLVGPFTYDSESVATVAQTMYSAMLIFPKLPTLSCLALVAEMVATGGDLVFDLNPEVGNGYHVNDNVGHRDFFPLLAKHKDHTFGIYGDEDEIFDEGQLGKISSTITPAHFTMMRASSHMPFVDQQSDFIAALTRFLPQIK